jgi:hypothetical protein
MEGYTMAESLATEAWVLARVGNNTDRVEVLGIFGSRKSAEENAALFAPQGWQIIEAGLLGWGFIRETGRVLDPGPISCPSYEVH